ncbi:MAG: hypothetical protein JWQ40_3770 [Segetibacter sp.]|jgi:hypothetical protein|nr:hypothetical protein [Segetibacter sp.]
MSKIEQTIVQGKIAEIIDTSRHGEEMFFTDSKTAASDILKYLQNEKIIPQQLVFN